MQIKARKVVLKILESSHLAYIETKILMITLKQLGKTSPKMHFLLKLQKFWEKTSNKRTKKLIHLWMKHIRISIAIPKEAFREGKYLILNRISSFYLCLSYNKS